MPTTRARPSRLRPEAYAVLIGTLLLSLVQAAPAQPVAVRSFPFGGPIGSVQPTDLVASAGSGGSTVTGWSLAVCVDSTRLSVSNLEYGALGSPAEFFTAEVVPGGWTSSAIVSTTGTGLAVAPYSSRRLIRAEYEILGPAGTTQICTCDTLGVPLEVSTLGGTFSADPICHDFVIQETAYAELDLVDRTVYYSSDSPSRQFTVDVTLAQPDGVSPHEPQGFSFGVSHDPTLVEPVDFFTLGQLTYFGDAAPFSGQFLQFVIGPEGWWVGCVFGGFHPLTFGPEPEGVLRALYATVPSGLDGSEIETALEFTTSLGSPPVATVVVIGGASRAPVVSDGHLTFVPFDGDLFRRGDCNDDGNVDIADGVTILSELFSGGAPGSCPAACDLNVDATYDIADPIYVFNYILLGGPPPPSPFEECGGADTSFPCPSFNSCD